MFLFWMLGYGALQVVLEVRGLNRDILVKKKREKETDSALVREREV